MPKVKTCKCTIDGAVFEAHMNVNSDGVFSIARPGSVEDWNGEKPKFEGKTADELEQRWRAAVLEWKQARTTDRKVIIVRYDSSIRPGGRRNFFNGKEFTLLLEARVALERTTVQGTATKTHYMDIPDRDWKDQPFPVMMTLSSQDLNFTHEDWCVVDWTQELEDTIVRACKGIEAIVDLFEKVLTSPEKMQLAAQLMPQLMAGTVK